MPQELLSMEEKIKWSSRISSISEHVTSFLDSVGFYHSALFSEVVLKYILLLPTQRMYACKTRGEN